MDKVCAVFGGSRGIGRAVAQLMARKGYRLAIIARNLDVAKAAAGELGGRYRTGVVQLCGCRPSAIRGLVCKTSRSGLYGLEVEHFGFPRAGAFRPEEPAAGAQTRFVHAPGFPQNAEG